MLRSNNQALLELSERGRETRKQVNHPINTLLNDRDVKMSQVSSPQFFCKIDLRKALAFLPIWIYCLERHEQHVYRFAKTGR